MTAQPQSLQDALKIVEITARRSRQKVEEWRLRRDNAVLIARNEGASLRQIAEATELSHTAIKKILDRRRMGSRCERDD